VSINVYLAGKISGNNWREKILPVLRHNAPSPWAYSDRPLPKADETKALPICAGFSFIGPFFLECECDHLNHYRLEDSHGVGANESSAGDHGRLCGPKVASPRQVVELCLGWVDRADAVFAWLDDVTAYGTMIELGYAYGKGIPIWVYRQEPLYVGADTGNWFADHLAVKMGWASKVQEAWADFTSDAETRLKAIRLRRMEYSEYLLTPHWKERRAQALAAAEYRCVACNSPDDLTVHHRTYERRGEELLTDLTVFCKTCHAKFHGNRTLADSLLPSEEKRRRQR
jgi:nucleoside 2-deoxyribosyltransferase